MNIFSLFSKRIKKCSHYSNMSVLIMALVMQKEYEPTKYIVLPQNMFVCHPSLHDVAIRLKTLIAHPMSTEP